MKLFWYALKKEVRLSQETIRLIKQCLFLVDEPFQRSREVSRIFLEIIGDLKKRYKKDMNYFLDLEFE